jgi:hypothetical protein
VQEFEAKRVTSLAEMGKFPVIYVNLPMVPGYIGKPPDHVGALNARPYPSDTVLRTWELTTGAQLISIPDRGHHIKAVVVLGEWFKGKSRDTISVENLQHELKTKIDAWHTIEALDEELGNWLPTKVYPLSGQHRAAYFAKTNKEARAASPFWTWPVDIYVVEKLDKVTRDIINTWSGVQQQISENVFTTTQAQKVIWMRTELFRLLGSRLAAASKDYVSWHAAAKKLSGAVVAKARGMYAKGSKAATDSGLRPVYAVAALPTDVYAFIVALMEGNYLVRKVGSGIKAEKAATAAFAREEKKSRASKKAGAKSTDALVAGSEPALKDLQTFVQTMLANKDKALKDIVKLAPPRPDQVDEVEMLIDRKAMKALHDSTKPEDFRAGAPMDAFSWMRGVQALEYEEIAMILELVVKGLISHHQAPTVAKGMTIKKSVMQMILQASGAKTWGGVEDIDPCLVQDEFIRHWVFSFRGQGGRGQKLFYHSTELARLVQNVVRAAGIRRGSIQRGLQVDYSEAKKVDNKTEHVTIGTMLKPRIDLVRADVYNCFEIIKPKLGEINIENLGMFCLMLYLP